ncbi:MAG: rhamnulokinase, partial [Clostridia bacterium]|nr:rhamnulokinase [Clostridia bacterium]
IDTWGVDYGFLDKEGNLLGYPYHYRDVRTNDVFEAAYQVVPTEEMYARTGTQQIRFNTLFQLYIDATENNLAYREADTVLMMADLFAYLLTGKKAAEYSLASTTQMMNPVTHEWDYELIKKMGIRTDILPEIIPAGSIYGNLLPDLCEELGCNSVPVIAVCTHDTGSAVAAVPSDREDFCYISCGTWSLMGIENKEPCLSEEAQKQNFTNEGGFDYSIRFLKNIMGLWIIQECRRQWQREGIEISFAEIAAQAEASACTSMVDPDDASFELPGDMPERIREYCRKTGQEVPESIGDIGRVVYTSLAMKYRYTLENIAKITGKSYGSIHIVGGGCNATMLCRLAADCCNVPVYAGPGEATALGNIAVQLIALGELKDLKDARAAVARSEKLAVYQPQTDMSALYAKFLQIIGA